MHLKYEKRVNFDIEFFWEYAYFRIVFHRNVIRIRYGIRKSIHRGCCGIRVHNRVLLRWNIHRILKRLKIDGLKRMKKNMKK